MSESDETGQPRSIHHLPGWHVRGNETVMDGVVWRWRLTCPWSPAPEVSASTHGVSMAGCWPVIGCATLDSLHEILKRAEAVHLSLARFAPEVASALALHDTAEAQPDVLPPAVRATHEQVVALLEGLRVASECNHERRAEGLRREIDALGVELRHTGTSQLWRYRGSTAWRTSADKEPQKEEGKE